MSTTALPLPSLFPTSTHSIYSYFNITQAYYNLTSNKILLAQYRNYFQRKHEIIVVSTLLSLLTLILFSLALGYFVMPCIRARLAGFDGSGKERKELARMASVKRRAEHVGSVNKGKAG